MAVKKTGKKKSKRVTKAQREARVQLLSVVLFTVGLLLSALAFVKGNSGWLAMHNVLFGFFGAGAFFIGPVFCYISVMTSFDKIESDTNIRMVLTGITILIISAANQIFGDGAVSATTLWGGVKELYIEGTLVRGGGLMGSIFAIPLMMLGKPGDGIAVVLILFMLFMILTKSTVAGVIKKMRRPAEKIKETYNEISEMAYIRASEKQEKEEAIKTQKRVIDIPINDEEIEKPVKKEKNKLADILKKENSVAPDVEMAKEVNEETREKSPIDEQDDDFLDDENKSHIEEIIRRVQESNHTTPKEELTDELFGEAHYTEEPTELVEEKTNDDLQFEDAREYNEAVEEAVSSISENEIEGEQTSSKEKVPEEPYVYEKPSTELLNVPQNNLNEKDTTAELRQNAERLVDTLQSFGVQTRIVDICRGPSVTRYELQPSAGVKISKITNLADDIALNLAAAGVRIEAPIPNKAAVGIEIPNKNVSFVSLREVVASTSFENAKSPVTIALGKDVSGDIKVADIEKMPHLLIAGATGSGKSVCINSIIMSLIFKSDPKDVKLMLVDPKMVELGVYNGIPHLVVPVVNDAKKAAGVLGWAVGEMLKRYQTFATNGVRDIKSYNKLCLEKENDPENKDMSLNHMPHIVIIVDELADLMMAAPRDVEDHICRLAQMARAAGMHLIIATQRPSVDVITGVIKANIPSRIAFAVSSQIDSRTILDMAGAEKLIGMGDMLFFPVGSSKPTRIQGCFVSDEEIERVVEFIKADKPKEETYDDTVMSEIEKHVPVEKGSGNQGSSSTGDDGDEEIIRAAIEIVVESQMASTSFLQRKLKLGYARAARVVDELEARGIVGPFEGSKPRQVLMSRERLMEMKLMNNQ